MSKIIEFIPKIIPKERANSSNFFVSLLSILFFILNYNGAGIEENAAELIISGTVIGIINVVLPLIKWASNLSSGNWSWKFLKAPNFYTQIIVALTALAEWQGWIPSGTAVQVASLHGANMTYHFATYKPKEELKVA